MRYFIDTEFQEGFHKPIFGKRRHFIDLISIAIVAEDGREYYAISKDFDIEKAWNSYDLLEANTNVNHSLNEQRVYWLRENVLKPIIKDFWINKHQLSNLHHIGPGLTLSNLKRWIKLYGKTNDQIQRDIRAFVYAEAMVGHDGLSSSDFWISAMIEEGKFKPEFYAYYADYDWVLFCSLFGRMIDLPVGFPMYCRDIKQLQDEVDDYYKVQGIDYSAKENSDYPFQVEGEHNAFMDARWNKNLFDFLSKVRETQHNEPIVYDATEGL